MKNRERLYTFRVRFCRLFTPLLACATVGALPVFADAQTPFLGWQGYGNNAQHTANSTVPTQPLERILWTAPLDADRSYYGADLLIHYASPVITPKNTMVHTYRFSVPIDGGFDRDNWRLVARNAANGRAIWQLNTDYSAPVIWPQNWTSVYPMTLATTGGTSPVISAVGAGGGGTILVRNNPDVVSTVAPKRISFYEALAKYTSNPAAFKGIKVCTPLTADGAGNIWFGYLVSSANPAPAALASLGTGGVVRVNVNGQVAFKSVDSLAVDSALTRPALNAAPALSNDGKSVYFALTNPGQNTGYLVKLNSTTLDKQASVLLKDPSGTSNARLIDQSSACPIIGPDGRVFMGVFGASWRESHGWTLQFDANLKATDANNKLFPAGAFGWDDTASIVPATAVPSYKGTSKYLLLTKYNNYAIGSGDGINQIAVLDPGSNAKSKDRQSGIAVMDEILKVNGPTPDFNLRDQNHRFAVREWCINSAAVDVANKSAILNSEDGRVYRWSFVTNKLVEGVALQPATGEAYTSTLVGPDGVVYAINNSYIHAVGKKASRQPNKP